MFFDMIVQAFEPTSVFNRMPMRFARGAFFYNFDLKRLRRVQ